MAYNSKAETFVRMTDEGPQEITHVPKSTAPPTKQIDVEMVRKLASIFCSLEEIGLIVGCSHELLRQKYMAFYQEGLAKGKMSLRRRQVEEAMKGNAGLLTWLGKQYLGQSEKLDQRVLTASVDQTGAVDSEVKKNFMAALGTRSPYLKKKHELKGTKVTVINEDDQDDKK